MLRLARWSTTHRPYMAIAWVALLLAQRQPTGAPGRGGQG